MTFDKAMEEVEVERACEALRLDDDATAFVLASYRHSADLLRTILEHNGDHRCYVESKLLLRAAIDGQPDPVFPPREP